MIKITFPNKEQKIFDHNSTAIEIAQSISESFAKNCIAAKLNNEIVDMNKNISENSNIYFITPEDPEGLKIIRHTTAHIMAQAVTNIFPKTKLAIGPVIKDGFYYDFDIQPLSKEELPKIITEMKNIVKAKIPITRIEISKNDAIKYFKNEPYKLEIISDLNNKILSIYKQGNFIDLCKGPHAPHTGFVKHFKLTHISGAYWRSNQSMPQLQRIYGTAFFNKNELKKYIYYLEESKKRNHKKIATQMNLFSFYNEAPGMPLFHPNGMIIWNNLIKYWKEEHQKEEYSETKTPIMLSRSLWEKSGHWMNYKNNMYVSKIDNRDYAIKPMNCPGTMLFYNNTPHSYKELPIKIAEIGLVHRHELSGVLNGLFRVRAFHQDDAHIFVTPNQIYNEILNLLILEEKIYKTFGLKFNLELSTRPKKSIGTNLQWEITTNALISALNTYSKPYTTNIGSGAFYGPKIDLHIKDALNRTWQCGTIQLDMSLPERFDLNYIDKNNKKSKVIVIHRTVFGSIERFLGVLIEHFNGKFPLWLAPIQVIILPINDSLIENSEKLADNMRINKIRVEVDTKTDRIGKKVRNAQIKKIPLILVYGNKENSSDRLSVRTFNNQIFKDIKTSIFIKTIKKHISERKLNFNFIM